MNTSGFDPEEVSGKSHRVFQGKDTDRALLAAIARQAKVERSLEPDFPTAALQELAVIRGPARPTEDTRDVERGFIDFVRD